MAARFVPLLAFMLFGGVIADRFQRNRLVGGSDMLGSFLAAISAISLIAGFSSTWLLALMGGLFGILNAIWWPAMSGVLPEILPKEKLQEGNAVIGLMTNIGYIIGTLGGGILVSTVGAGWGLLVDASSFFIAGAIVWNHSRPCCRVERIYLSFLGYCDGGFICTYQYGLRIYALSVRTA
jgi:MFS family permease